jgi:hypothetical protein
MHGSSLAVTAIALALPALSLRPCAQATELDQLRASDGTIQSHFADAVSISGDRALIGARWEDTLGEDSGAAYVFERDAGGAWVEVARLAASDGGKYDEFGFAVALGVDFALVSAPYLPGVGQWRGAVYAFDRDSSGAWTQSAKLVSSDRAPFDRLGYSLALSDNRVLIGAPNKGGGVVYVFERDASGVWSEVAKLVPTDGEPDGFYGWPMALSGDRALIAATESLGYLGKVYVYERDGNGVWQETARLLEPLGHDGEASLFFGEGVAISGDRLVVGIGSDDDLEYGAGAAYVFERAPDASWSQVAKLFAPDGEYGDNFGGEVGIAGDRILIGAYQDDGAGDDAGSVYVFGRRRSGDWGVVDKLQASNGDARDNFGAGFSISGDRVLVGAQTDEGPSYDVGSAYLFDLSPLRGDVAEIPLSSGGAQAFSIDAGHLHAGEVYLLLGSTSGTLPGIPLGGGLELPLHVDAYFQSTLAYPNTPPLSGSLGVLSANGVASATFQLPAGSDPQLAGLTVHHAFVAIELAGPSITFASNAASVVLVP